MTHLLQANALRIPLADESVHMVVTSPPYWNLRDYGTATWEGGEAEWINGKKNGKEYSLEDLPMFKEIA